MPLRSNRPLDTLIYKLETLRPLSSEERSIIEDLPLTVRSMSKGHDVVREGDRPTRSIVIIDGWVCRYKMTQDGRRQILSFHVSGDIPDLQSLLLTKMDHGVMALTPVQIGLIPHEALHEINNRFPRLAEALWRDTLVDASIYREWLLGIGQRSVAEHMAHVFCEMFMKMKAVGLANDGDSCAFPISQAELGDALGASAVHVNRTLQDLRAQGLLSWDRGQLLIHDWDGLKQLSGFDPSYLHITNPQPRHSATDMTDAGGRG